MIKNNDIDKNHNVWIPYIIIYLFLLFKAGFCFIEHYNRITAPLLIALLIVFGLIYQKRVKTKPIIITLVLICLMVFSWIFHGFPEINELLLDLLNLATAILIASFFTQNEFLELYKSLILVICVFSIAGWLIIQYFGIYWFSYLPSLLNSANRVGKFAIFTIVSDFSIAGMQRTQGVFWEPGAFQALIVLTMIIELYSDDSKDRMRIIQIVYSIAIVLSFSTTGYVALVLVWILILNSSSKNFKFLKTALFLACLSLLYIKFSAKLSGFMHYTIVDKIQALLHYSSINRTSNFSVSARWDSIVIPVRMLLEDPIFGMGVEGIKKMSSQTGHINMVCTPINYFAVYGVAFGVACYLGFCKLLRKLKLQPLDFCVAILALLVAFSTEDFFLNPILTVLIFYGYMDLQLLARND